LLMHPNENLNIPFKFQSFQSGQVAGTEVSGTPHGPVVDDEPIRPRTINVAFIAETNPNSNYQANALKAICILEIKVVPQPFVIDRTFRFYNAENDFLKKNILYETKPGQPRKYIKCSNSAVVVGYNPQRSEHDTPDIFLKARCGPSPTTTRFYLQLYNDPFQATLAETWQVFMHALQRVDVAATAGQTTKATLILRGGASSRTVQCFSSHPELLRVNPATSFTLVAGALNEVNMVFMPLHPNNKEIYVHVVDVEFHQLVSAWLIQTTTTNPSITKSFEMVLPIGKGSNKKISYTNPYPHPKTFLLRTNCPHLLQFKEPKLEIKGRDKAFIGLKFVENIQIHGLVDILVFINDADYDKNEECISLAVTYVDE